MPTKKKSAVKKTAAKPKPTAAKGPTKDEIKAELNALIRRGMNKHPAMKLRAYILVAKL